MPRFKTVLSGPTPMTVELTARSVAMSPPLNGPACPDCQAPLDLHQPDVDRPTHLLCTCALCSRWFFLLEIDADWNEAVLVELPSAETIREMLEV